jgi:hypothetical protein
MASLRALVIVGWSGRLWSAAAISAALLAVPVSVLAADAPQVVSARYNIVFGGVEIGRFNFNSKVTGRRYDLASDSKVKLLFGMFKWSSEAVAQGSMERTVSPQSFEFNYQIKKKRKRSAIQFADGRVTKLENDPPINHSSKYVPLEKKHLISVLDPMSAIMSMTRVEGEPCRDTLEVFDGVMRFQLKLSPNGKRQIKERQPSGQPSFGYVCRIKFKPIAGYKKESNIKYISENDGIEVVLRPVPSAKILVPYEIRVPTMLGSVIIAAQTISVVDRSNRRIAMVH